MLYVDYNWDLSQTMIIPDKELNTDRLGWKPGDYWQVTETVDGQKMLKKVDPLVQFILGKHNE